MSENVMSGAVSSKQWLIRGMSRGTRTSVNLWPMLAVVAVALCWLTPNHYMPWLSFDADFGMAAVTLLLAWGYWINRKTAWSVPKLAVAASAAAVVPLMQLASGLIYFSGDAWMFSAGLAGFALAVTFGSTLAITEKDGFVADMVLAAALCASIASAGIQLRQWLQLASASDIDGLGLWLMALPPRSRPFGNLAQPNQLSTLLLWGLAGVAWLFVRRRIGGLVAVLAAGYLLFGLAMTQSRSGWGGLLIIAIAAWVYRKPLGLERCRLAVVALAVFFIGVTVFWSSINDALYLSAAESMESRMTAGARALNWKVCLSAIAQRPWFGFGWGQVAVAQQSAVLLQPASGEYFAYSHNIVLDMVLWNGLPLGGLMVLSLAVWLAGRLKRVSSAEGAVLSMAIGAFLVHASFEYPHAYTYFLLPLGIMLGALSAVTRDRSCRVLPRTVVAAPLVTMTLFLAWLVHDYVDAAANMERLRFEVARIGSSRHSEPPKIMLLTQLREYLTALRIDIHKVHDVSTLDQLRKIAERYASDSSLYRYAMSAAVSGHPELAVPALQRLCWIHTKDDCHEVRSAWSEEARNRHPEMEPVLEAVESYQKDGPSQ